jgi:hypothetical protein
MTVGASGSNGTGTVPITCDVIEDNGVMRGGEERRREEERGGEARNFHCTHIFDVRN